MSGVIGGQYGYYLLRRLAERDRFSGRGYQHRSEVESLFGAGLRRDVAKKTVIVYGSGGGREAIDIACHGALRVVGIETDPILRAEARRKAEEAGVDDRCSFVAECREEADVVLSIGGFDHDDDPASTLQTMHGLLRPGGVALVSFGPPWLHPFGGHAFSVFPWAHLIFTEDALARWCADFTPETTSVTELGRGPSRMTVRRFYRTLAESEFEIDRFECVPRRRWAWMANPLTREFVTSVVRCRLIARPTGRVGGDAAVPIWLEDEVPASSW